MTRLRELERSSQPLARDERRNSAEVDLTRALSDVVAAAYRFASVVAPDVVRNLSTRGSTLDVAGAAERTTMTGMPPQNPDDVQQIVYGQELAKVFADAFGLDTVPRAEGVVFSTERSDVSRTVHSSGR